ncbi:N-acetylglucosamine-6-phosphate deacetylase [Anabaena cylindrica FACHB-243]|uniref:N-acetylglucosamine 6-phosphate deacetylase n=1 Tax=Anabaena cylindrica (strain ATCC 27899 / PCC 7122) TaxID=272123 RepID=K9ZKS5_ANACC|nr:MULTISPECIES: N-acetylglucosamine-6-phosphate deacetylase [Anabaena]AFZ59796.1 N-acetylglucosamine 6-phosphate deacetylase [Anabaena cylindrica PCC 7122]MBD2417198.1 N-acetylglucosamine-6-phosphate deacetylase [Anabaena cylindrica FACHB-243]MBY5282282.1 N-acetylglucosamine-6-phosphate deacetylase [Anabaena sp. CCAP 1446/1C]MBY5309792.1 N-acetylglucosamine-6-phosphate deacetylase [Anabaena sp. CCAP 1446/1C]MCM2404986.1 N-acetylglucosamine-6-phosphate deacetylase [Anabaena sp. CCAP 1446/1C]
MTKATPNSILTNVDIINVRVPGYQDLQMIWVNETGIIEQILPMGKVCRRVTPEDLQILDFAGDWISLGGVDLQINGGLGLAFPDLTVKNAHMLEDISQYLWNVGVDGYLPTLVTTSVENIQRSLAVISNYTQNSGAKILGVHLEGPFLNYGKRGAHPAEYLLPLTMNEVKRVLGDYASVVKVITLAPELDPTDKVIPYLHSLGITVSLGHSQATAEQAQNAFDQGATMLTHAFNAMPPLHHREPGLLGAAMNHPDVMCSFIADGQHVVPTMLEILLRASKGLFLVSDALAPLGLPDGVYPWDDRQIEIINGTARLFDGTLSGTTLPLLTGVKNLVKWGICGVEKAIFLATDAPRKAINLPTIAPNQPANLLRWHYEEETQELTWERL